MLRWLPFPLQSLFLLVLWLLLNQTLALGHIILGIVIAILGGLALRILDLPKTHFRRPLALVQLMFLVLVDIVRSNIAVARIVLGGQKRDMTSGFMEIPLDIRAPYGLAMLGVIITSTPGTLWVGFNSASGMLTIHVLDLVDESTWIKTIKQRYERLLMEIFE